MPRILRILVAVVLTAIVLYTAHPSDVIRATSGADVRWLAAAVGLVLVDRSLMALRWIDLLVALTPGSRPPFGRVLRIFFVSSFVSNFVPSVAADMYRAYALARCDVHLAESTASVLMDRVLGVLSMVLVGACALPFARDLGIARGLILALSVAFAGCAAAGSIVFSEGASAIFLRIMDHIPVAAVRRATAALTEAVRRYSRHHGALTRVLAMSVAVQAIRVVQAWCLGEALGMDLPLLVYFAAVPVILLIMQVPITINGLGTSQVAFVTLLAPTAADAAPATALSLLFLALGIVGSLPGGIIYAVADRAERPGAQPS
ncbi:MAG: flippase-like domain-containing protein [Acidobacteria bacterium]|nr:flippase-like domain-containing protein [Acidobacteriota bacterium]